MLYPMLAAEIRQINEKELKKLEKLKNVINEKMIMNLFFEIEIHLLDFICPIGLPRFVFLSHFFYYIWCFIFYAYIIVYKHMIVYY